MSLPEEIPTALIVTLQMDAHAAARFTGLRRTYFPPERNWLDAHITLFHALPPASSEAVLRDCAEAAAATVVFPLRVARLHFLGAGVAFALSSDHAVNLREALSHRWTSLLGPQDRNWRGPLHVTVQNKVHHSAARRLQAQLEAGFTPYDIGAVGLQVWHYLGGPWRLLASFPFALQAA